LLQNFVSVSSVLFLYKALCFFVVSISSQASAHAAFGAWDVNSQSETVAQYLDTADFTVQIESSVKNRLEEH